LLNAAYGGPETERTNNTMGIGSGILLFVIGAILTFALNFRVDWIDLDLVGYILMIAGAVVFIISLVVVFRRRSLSSTTRTSVDPARGERITERDTTDDTL
jgi:FtsH-binding integral membrane protein